MDWAQNMIQRTCAFCGKPADQEHHNLPNTKMNRATYGKLLDRPFNKTHACSGCNPGHNFTLKEGQEKEPHWAVWDEARFRKEAIVNGYELPAGTKSYENKERF